jgi:hypothetical protein
VVAVAEVSMAAVVVAMVAADTGKSSERHAKGPFFRTGLFCVQAAIGLQ